MYAFRAIFEVRACYRGRCPAAVHSLNRLQRSSGSPCRAPSAVKLVTSYPRRTFTCVFTWTGGAAACSFLTLANSLMAAR
jgi:hypothetical protein